MKTLKYLAIAATALLVTSCTDDAIDGLKGIFQAPTPCTFNSATCNDVTKDGNKRFFDVTLTNQAGDRMDVKFVGDNYFLQPAAFTPGTSDNPKTGFYLTDLSSFKFANGSVQPIERGQIQLDKDGDDYSISGNIWLADQTVVKLGGGFTLHFEADPEPTLLTKVLSVTNNVPNGTNSITLQLATEDVTSQFDPATWSTTYSGQGNFLAVDFYSEDGTLAPGVYSPADSNAMAPFTYGKGWDPGDLWGIGMEFTNWGTCWWTVDNGATSAVHLEEGDIEVAAAGGIFTITYNNGGIYFSFSGPIEGLDAGAGDEPVFTELTNFLSFTNNVPNGSPSVTVKVGTDGIGTSPNAWGGVDLTGSGNYLAIDFYSEDGTLAPGTYTAADNSEMGAGNFAKGYDPGDIWGIGMEFTNWGTCWFTRSDDAETGLHVEDGTITVEVSGDTYTITLVSSIANAKYTGKLN